MKVFCARPFTLLFMAILCILLLTVAACGQSQPTALPTLMALTTDIPLTDIPAAISIRPTLPQAWTPTFTFTPTPDYSPTPSLTPTLTLSPTETITPTAQPTIAISRDAIVYIRSGLVQKPGPGDEFIGDIYILDAVTGNEIRFTDTETIESWPRWSPDGTQLLYTTSIHGAENYHLYIQAADGSYPPRLILSGMSAVQANWSPDGKFIIFVSKVDDYTDLFIVDINGKNLIQLTQTDGIDESQPDWSPDGSQILYSRRSSHRTGDRLTMMIVDANCINVPNECANSKMLATGYFPAWSPDGQKIAYSAFSETDQAVQIYTIDIDGSNVRQVTQEGFGGSAEMASWSSDGSQIVYRHAHPVGEWELFIINVDGSGSHAITDYPLREEFPDWRP